jgi:hypothetical protein
LRIGQRLTLGKLTKNQKKREIMNVAVKKSKQSTIDNVYFEFNISKTKKASKSNKAIIITDIFSTPKEEDELELKIGFSLLPSKVSFSKINLDLFFEDHLVNSKSLIIPQSLLLSDSFEYPQVLDMKGIAEGNYLIRIEMYEPWSSNEKLSFNFKEITVRYTPKTGESRFVKIPTVRSIAGTDLTVVSSKTKNIFNDIKIGRAHV